MTALEMFSILYPLAILATGYGMYRWALHQR